MQPWALVSFFDFNAVLELGANALDLSICIYLPIAVLLFSQRL